MVNEKVSFVEFIYCHCGCGKTTSKYKFQEGRPRKDRINRYIYGHFFKVNKFPESKLRREKHHWWKGGECMHRGYRMIYKPDHPYAWSTGLIYEHRLVMEQHLGRYLRPDELVHHINEDLKDNRIENLQVMTRAEHMRHHNNLGK
jgi:hypothetical protein